MTQDLQQIVMVEKTARLHAGMLVPLGNKETARYIGETLDSDASYHSFTVVYSDQPFRIGQTIRIAQMHLKTRDGKIIDKTGLYSGKVTGKGNFHRKHRR